MTTLLHLSDPHFGTEQPDVVDALLAFAHAQAPDLVVLSGDITQRARAAQFATAKNFVAALGAPVLAIPGNHDIALFNLLARVFRPYAAYARVFGADLAPVYDTGDLLVIGVNTTRPWRHKHGEVSAQQIRQVATQLQAARPEQLRVVVVHQPVAVPEESETHNLVRGHRPALQAWAQAGADVVLGGHIHLPCVLPLTGLARPMWAIQAGTAVSRRTRAGGPNSVNLLRWDASVLDGACAVERWDYSAADAAFMRADTTRLRPSRS
jgi:3',5'-cyclic AMP phosphodiesterase CpdA